MVCGWEQVLSGEMVDDRLGDLEGESWINSSLTKCPCTYLNGALYDEKEFRHYLLKQIASNKASLLLRIILQNTQTLELN